MHPGMDVSAGHGRCYYCYYYYLIKGNKQSHKRLVTKQY